MKGKRSIPAPKVIKDLVYGEERSIDVDDVEKFLQVESRDDLEKLIARYGSLLESPFGDAPVDAFGSRSTKNAVTPEDVMNLSILMRAALNLFYLMGLDVDPDKTLLRSWVDFSHYVRAREGAGIEARDCAFLRIELEDAPRSLSFIRKGMEAAQAATDNSCSMMMFDEEDEHGNIVPMLSISTGFTVSDGYVEKLCFERMLNALSRVVLQDVSFQIRDGRLCVVPGSIASSLWLCLLEGGQNYRARRCKVCGKPFIALNEKQNKRVFCGKGCKTKYSRLKSFYDHREEGMPEAAAAKQAKIDLETAVTYWQYHEPDWLDD